MITRKNLIIILTAAISVMFGGCTDVHLSHILSEYQKKPYEQQWKSGEITVKCQVVLPEAMAAFKALQVYGDTISKSCWDSLCAAENDQMLSFRLRIEPGEKIRDTVYTNNTDIEYGFGQSAEERTASVNFFNYELSKHIWILVNSEKIYPSICHTEQSFGMENGRNVWISYKLTEKEKKMVLQQEKCSLFFQMMMPLRCVAMLEWPVNVIKKCI